MSENQLYLSVVVPLYNEEGDVKELHERIKQAAQSIGRLFEIIFIDDGSRDKTLPSTRGLSPLKLIVFRKNFGQTAAFDAGIKAAKGEIIITLDGDLQNDPADIPFLLAKIDEGYDVVSGWRFNRQDSLMKRFFSRGANLLRKILIKDNIHDSGCSLKAYRRECFRSVDLFGEMHRFIPALLQLEGFRVTEVKVSHHPRIHGMTKYNWKRAIKGFVDMLSIWFWRKYSYRPLHLFGGGGMFLFTIGSGILVWMLTLKIFFGASLSERLWPLVGIFFVLIGVQLFVSGLLADMVVRNYYQTRNRMNYSIREIREQ
ncbi:MAG: glycosyl transferase family 2 [Candidatus Moranbacteria bacterium RIFCSPLOWO2_02_FULL_48_19]|nr:MAG: glycosyl transferase family 2 [Candidatus Moranbacteria bacterium RIFCSPLOWO2_02_FULL_48_19]OGI30584.1 MAG: glycosyl transferase family 2 [Candidatus Moranbacteria bacterium RIFCSPLOWO2_12_FULL_48_12]